MAQTINELVERIRLKGDRLPSKRLLEQNVYGNRVDDNDLDCKDCHCRSEHGYSPLSRGYDCSPDVYDCNCYSPLSRDLKARLGTDASAASPRVATVNKLCYAGKNDCEDCHNCNDCSNCGNGDCSDCDCVDCQRDDC